MAMTKCPGCNLLVIHSEDAEEVELDRSTEPPALLVGGRAVHRCRHRSSE